MGAGARAPDSRREAAVLRCGRISSHGGTQQQPWQGGMGGRWRGDLPLGLWSLEGDGEWWSAGFFVFLGVWPPSPWGGLVWLLLQEFVGAAFETRREFPFPSPGEHLFLLFGAASLLGYDRIFEHDADVFRSNSSLIDWRVSDCCSCSLWLWSPWQCPAGMTRDG